MRHDSAKRHILVGGCTPRWGAMTPNSNLAEIFVQCAYPEVLSSCFLCVFVRKLSCWHTNPQTNRCRRKHTTFFSAPWCWV